MIWITTKNGYELSLDDCDVTVRVAGQTLTNGKVAQRHCIEVHCGNLLAGRREYIIGNDWDSILKEAENLLLTFYRQHKALTNRTSVLVLDNKFIFYLQ